MKTILVGIIICLVTNSCKFQSIDHRPTTCLKTYSNSEPSVLVDHETELHRCSSRKPGTLFQVSISGKVKPQIGHNRDWWYEFGYIDPNNNFHSLQSGFESTNIQEVVVNVTYQINADPEGIVFVKLKCYKSLVDGIASAKDAVVFSKGLNIEVKELQ